jgi:L-2,4-diaminobutyrate decarboxylase
MRPTPDSLAALLQDLERDGGREAAGAFTKLAVEYLAATRTGEGSVSTARTPSDLSARFEEPLPAAGHSLEDVIGRIARDILPDCNRLTHPRAMGHQVSAPLAIAVWMEALTAALNQSAAVWEMSPVGTIIETQVVRWLCELARFPSGAGGSFTSGGTEATFAALLAARHAARPESWRQGVHGNPPAVVCGEHAHYAIARAVGQLGIGVDNIALVPSREFRMNVSALERTLDALRDAGREVMAVVATAGTTATGSFDDLERIGALCDERRIWLHLDGAHGASALFSPTHRARLAGVHRARSIAWDPHKMMLMPLSASVVLVRDERDLQAAFAQHAPYLFHGGDSERPWDQGLRSFQCSRRVDAFKVWVTVQRYGAWGFGALYDHLCATALELYRLIQRRPAFESLHEPESNILCFRYVGDGSLSDGACDALNQELRAAYNREGDGWITTTVLEGRRVLRATMMNPRTTGSDLTRVLDGLESLGKALVSDRSRAR